MTALRFKTGGRLQTSPASLQGFWRHFPSSLSVGLNRLQEVFILVIHLTVISPFRKRFLNSAILQSDY